MNDPVETRDGSFTLHSDRYGQTYHSTHGAVTEAQHVFLNTSGVSERLQHGLATRVLEIGFGLGLNAILTTDLALKHGTTLDYHAFENDLVSHQLISMLNYASLIQHKRVADALVEIVSAANNAPDKSHKVKLSDTQVSLHLLDATTTPIIQQCGVGFHAIYLDAFSPDTNEECWSAEFFENLIAVMADNACLSTYSVKGTVRRALQSAGFSVRKLPGPPGKREILLAQK